MCIDRYATRSNKQHKDKDWFAAKRKFASSSTIHGVHHITFGFSQGCRITMIVALLGATSGLGVLLIETLVSYLRNRIAQSSTHGFLNSSLTSASALIMQSKQKAFPGLSCLTLLKEGFHESLMRSTYNNYGVQPPVYHQLQVPRLLYIFVWIYIYATVVAQQEAWWMGTM